MVLVLGLILVGFVLGVVTVVAAEALGVLLIIKRLSNKIKQDEASSSKSEVGSAELDPQQSLSFCFNKKGFVWVLESEKVPKVWQEKTSREPKRKKEFLEISPVKKYGKIKGQSLILSEPDGSHTTTIQLKGCTVKAVSATSQSSKKWAKRFPIKLESKTSEILNGSNKFYIYLETSWEKEAWCKALYLASCDHEEKVNWFAKLNKEFHSYLMSLHAEYPFFMKPSAGFSVEAIDRDAKPDGASSKVRQFFKKIAKKTSSRVGLDNKSAWTSLSGREERKNTTWTSLSSHEERKSTDKLRASQDAVLATSLMKTASTAKLPKSAVEDNAASLLSSQSSHISVNYDTDPDEKFGIDEGTLCWNLLISRLFFDAKGNAQVKRSMQARIQRTLSNMRTPSYVGEIICSDIDLGNVPPCIIGIRVLPMEMSEVWAFEVDIEYSGGASLEIETRLEVRELDLYRGIENLDPESSNVEDVSSDILEEFEYFGKHLNLADGPSDVKEPKEDGNLNTDVCNSSKSTTSSATGGSRWKSIVNSIAKQVSQVPLSLAISVASLRGTLRLHIKPPPSDQLWFAFTSMPDIDFNLESSIRENKITSGRIAFFLANRIKAAIRENIVIPNCESICIPWMLAEKDDWVPSNVAPFIWVNQEHRNETPTLFNVPNQSPGEVRSSSRTSNDDADHMQLKSKNAQYDQEPARKSSDSLSVPSSSPSTLRSSKSLDELRTPLLKDGIPQETTDLELTALSLQNDRAQETGELKIEDGSGCQSPPRSLDLLDIQNHSTEQEDAKPKKMGRREKMLDFRKKMGEKFEEKRRNIEEKGRHIVEKMRGP